MKVGIIGPAQSGKTTLFSLLTGAEPGQGARGGGPPQATARVPDKRIDTLSSVFKPRKTTFATIEFADFPSLGSGCEITGEAAGRLKVCDALVVVLRAHRDPSVPWPSEPVTPDSAFINFLNEMALSDLCQVESILSRNKDKTRTPEETRILERCQALLEETSPISSGRWTEDEALYLRAFAFLSARPLLVAVNLDESQLMSRDYEGRAELNEACKAAGYPVIEFCGPIEREISKMDRDEQEVFLDEYGLEESGIARLAAAVYNLLDLCSFFTVGEDEVRAWTVRCNTPARKAAGKIHSDLERGFIRAEVIGFDEFMSNGASLKTARETGRLRLEGKEYPVKDGEIVHIRFNV